jgi:serine/threonine protein kinase
MELMEGGTLDDAIESRSEFLEKHIAFVARSMMSALAFLHNMGIAHRDLKAPNVMMSTLGEVKLIDFGIAAHFKEGEIHKEMVGSPYWMPPEMIRKGEQHTAATLLFAKSLTACRRAPRGQGGHLVGCYMPTGAGQQGRAQPRVGPPLHVLRRRHRGATAHQARPLEPCHEQLHGTACPCFRCHVDAHARAQDRMLQLDPVKRASADELTRHPFLGGCATPEEMKSFLGMIFMNNSLSNNAVF